MRILIVHNRYQQRGGEDVVFENESALLKSFGETVETLEFDNHDIIGAPKKALTSITSIYNPSSRKLLKNKINNFNPDIIHVHNIFYNASPSILYEAKKQQIPVVMTLHNYRLICAGALLTLDSKPCQLCINTTFPFHGIVHRCYQNSFIKSTQITITTTIHKWFNTWDSCVNKYICLTPFAKSIIEKSSLKVKPEKITLKPNFVDDFEPGKINEREDFYLFIGRLTDEKGLSTLLEAFDQSGIPLEIIGDGPMVKSVENHLKNNPNTTYHGFKDKAFILTKLKTCKALIFPSTWYEGMPITLLEAFSTATPIIASDIDNINSLVIDNFNGWLFETGNPIALKGKINALKKNEHWINTSENARKTYENFYSKKRNYEQLMTIYQSMLHVKKENTFS